MGGKGDIMLVYDAIRQSFNTIAVKVGAMVGADAMYDFVTETLGLRYIDESDADLAPLVLGSQYRGLTVVELANAYTMFNGRQLFDRALLHPRGGYERQPGAGYDQDCLQHPGHRTRNRRDHEPPAVQRLEKPRHGQRYEGRRPRASTPSARPVRTTDFKDFTFAGLTPYYSVAVWWGYDRPYDMSTVKYNVDGKPTQRAFKYLMEEVQAGLPAKEFYTNDNVIKAQFKHLYGFHHLLRRHDRLLHGRQHAGRAHRRAFERRERPVCPAGAGSQPACAAERCRPGCLSGKAAAASIKQKFRPRAQCRPGADMFDGQKHPALSVIQPNEGGADPGTPVQNNQKQEKTLCKTCNNGGPVLS